MHKLSLFFLSLLFFAIPDSHAQTPWEIRGVSVDTLANAKLVNTTISVLHAKDSTLLKFTRAQAGGTFSLPGMKPGKFILLVTYPGYADYVEHFALDSARNQKDFGTINLLLKENVLKEVLIKGEAIAIKIKGDTTEFNAAAYKIEPNSKVEDLIKQFPGIQVDQNGQITAQGEKVEKVLVDGEEFFGDDPTLVTKNLRGDMVDKVQLYDKKSDQATFTGIDDGEKTKTLNIQLKEDKKSGYFGKVDAGGASGDFYQGQGMFNMFKGKRKFSAYSTIGNTGKTGLNWRDSEKYGGSNNITVMDGGGIMITGGGDEFDSFDGRYNNQGIPLAHTGGVHYDSKWNGDKQSINTNYRVGRIAVDGLKSTLSQNNLPTGVLNSNSDQSFANSAFRQKLDVTYEIKLDTTSTLKVNVDGSVKNTETVNNFTAASLRNDQSLVNNSARSLNNEGEQRVFNAGLLWNKKLKKKGRTLSLNLKQSINENNTDGILNSVNSFFDEQGTVTRVQEINQRKINNSETSFFTSNLIYTEPLSKSLSAAINYGVDVNNSDADRRSFNRSASGEYSELDPAFSNNFSLDQFAHQFGTRFNYKKDKTVINLGTRAYAVDFRQLDNNTGTVFRRNFLNLFPQGSVQYNLAKQKNVRFDYYGNTSQPSIAQIQPVRVNDDPLNIVLGNPGLSPSYTSNLSTSFYSYKVLTERYLHFYASYRMTDNAIVNNVVTDAEGKNTYQSVNMTGRNATGFSFSGNVSRKVNPLGVSVGLGTSVRGNTSYNMINDALNKMQSHFFSGDVTFSKFVNKKYSFWVMFSPTYTLGESSLQPHLNDNGWGMDSRISASVTLPGKLQITTEGNYEYRQKTVAFNQDFDRMIWNTSLNKKFFKSENLTLSLSGNDLLDQNIGFSRSASGNFITQNNYNTIRRYFMFSVIWDFNKMGGGAPKTN